MTTGIASGLGATTGLALEATVGTFITPTTWIPFNKADFQLKKTPVVSQALRGSRFLEVTRRNVVEYGVDGSLAFDVAMNQFGKLFTACMGGTSPTYTALTSPAFLGTWTPGILEGVALSVQKGIPELPSGTIQAFSYAGCKITEWTLSLQRGGLLTLDLTLDGWSANTSTSYTAATYLTGASAPSIFSFNMGALKTGGSLTLNPTTLSTSTGSAPTAVVSGFSIKGSNKFKTDRYPLGSQTKVEQISNAFTEITGEIDIEFANLTDYYTPFVADTTEPLLFTVTGPSAIVAAVFPTIQVAISAAKYDVADVSESGPDVIVAKVPFTAYDDGNGNTVQIQYITTDTAP